MPTKNRDRILLCAPFGRDGALIVKQLSAAGFEPKLCDSVAEFPALLAEGAGVALIADEALRPDAVALLAGALANQPAWSDFPVVIMTSGGETTAASRARLQLLRPLGNVTLLERPLRVETLLSTMRAALRARHRQYQVEVLLAEKLANELEIRRRNEELTKVNRELEEFAYVSSHDLQEPLRMINIYTQLFTRHSVGMNEELQKYADVIHKGVSKMENLLRDLLVYSRTVHEDESDVATTELSAAVERAMTTLRPRIQESSALIRVGWLPVVRGDVGQLEQVFQNLLSNALKYSRRDAAPTIEISAERSGAEWIISVADDGIGFQPEYAEHIFGLFKRLHREEYPGTGLGLAICRRILERCGGRIWAEGRVGEGSTFRFTLADGSKPEFERD